jgi:ABC-2 type transport system permease protein
MRNTKYIFLREYLERVRTKAFVITTVLTPLIFAAIFGLPILLATRGGNQTQKVAVAQAAGQTSIVPVLRSRLERRPQAPRPDVQRNTGVSIPGFEFQPVEVAAGRESETRERLISEVRAGRLDGCLWFEGDPTAGGRIEYNGRNVTDMIALRTLEQAVSSAVVQLRLVSRGIPADDVQRLVKPVQMRTVRVSDKGVREERGITFIISIFFLMVLYMTLMLYGAAVMRSIIEEKTSRVFEVLLSSVKPMELLAGKILGGAAVGLTQYAVWILMALVAGSGMLGSLRTQMGEISVPGSLLFYFALFFVLGYLLYSTMFAALGAVVNSEQEAQQLQMTVMWFLIIPILVAQLVIRAPNSTAAVVLSLIPFFTPMLMFLRINLITPPAWQVALSIALLLATNFAVLWLSARIYRVGILMYGKRPTLPELVRWVRAT